MATPLGNWMTESWVHDAFLREMKPPTFFTDIYRERRPTVESIKADVAKLRSVSAAGRVLIADRRMALASVGPWRDTFIISGRDRSVFVKSRQEGLTYRTQMIAKSND